MRLPSPSLTDNTHCKSGTRVGVPPERAQRHCRTTTRDRIRRTLSSRQSRLRPTSTGCAGRTLASACSVFPLSPTTARSRFHAGVHASTDTAIDPQVGIISHAPRKIACPPASQTRRTIRAHASGSAACPLLHPLMFNVPLRAGIAARERNGRHAVRSDSPFLPPGIQGRTCWRCPGWRPPRRLPAIGARRPTEAALPKDSCPSRAPSAAASMSRIGAADGAQPEGDQ